MTPDTMALEAAANAVFHARKRSAPYDDRTIANAAIEAYLATHSQSLPDELKAIAEQHAKEDSPKYILRLHKEEHRGWREAHSHRGRLLSLIPDVVRACAKLAEKSHLDLISGPHQDWNGACRHIENAILSILSCPIKSESDIRRDTAREIVETIKGFEMLGPSPLGPLHAAGWNDVLDRLAASIRSTYGLTTQTEEA